MRFLLVLSLFAAVFSSGCGSSGDEDNPKLPIVVISVDDLLVDVGDRFVVSGEESSDPEGGKNQDLEFFWTALNETVQVTFDDRCEDDLEQICDENSDDLCSEPAEQACTTNADCAVGNCDTGEQQCEELQNQVCSSNDDCDNGTCVLNSGTSSPDCAEGICLLQEGREQPLASFVATAPGPYDLRLLVEGSRSNNVGLRTLQTYPSLQLVGSLVGFGGTAGGLIGASADADTFAANAVRGAGNPVSGNILLADPVLGAVREFDFLTTNVVGTFGETGVLTAPVALAFDAENVLYVANQDGTVQIFDGASGLLKRTFGDVTAAGEEVTSLLFVADSGNLLVVDGRAGQPLREYDIDTAALVGAFGATGDIGQAVDATYLGDLGDALLVADATGDVIECAADGTACAPFGSAGALLAPGGPTAVEINPSAAYVPESAVLIADRVSSYVVACTIDGAACDVFGDTEGQDSEYLDVLFAPVTTPTPDTTTTTISTTTTTLPSN
jgi:DNA-binding beta-propeller fold protein YncE